MNHQSDCVQLYMYFFAVQKKFFIETLSGLNDTNIKDIFIVLNLIFFKTHFKTQNLRHNLYWVLDSN